MLLLLFSILYFVSVITTSRFYLSFESASVHLPCILVDFSCVDYANVFSDVIRRLYHYVTFSFFVVSIIWAFTTDLYFCCTQLRNTIIGNNISLKFNNR